MLKIWQLTVIVAAIGMAAVACVEEVSRENPGELLPEPAARQASPSESSMDVPPRDKSLLGSDQDTAGDTKVAISVEPAEQNADQESDALAALDASSKIEQPRENADVTSPPGTVPTATATAGPTSIPTSTPTQVPPTPTQEPVALLPVLKSTRQVEIDPSQFRQMIPRDAIEPVYEPKFVSADQASLQASELVIGVEINGESRAYPVGPLNEREIVNDVVGGVPILVTW